MQSKQVRFARILSAWCLAVVAALATCAAYAADAPLRLRVVGGLANVNQYVRHEAPFWTQELPRLSGNAVTADIVPFDQAGFRGQDMLRLVQLGTVPFGTALLTRSQALDSELGAIDLPGMNPDMAMLRRTTAAYRPYLARILKERHGVELLALYTYPAQMVFCKRPFANLNDLAGRRVRVSGVSMGDLVRGLGATPVTTEFAEIVSNVRSGNVDCAITGSMSGNTIGLYEVTSHLYGMAITWGLSVFIANQAAWNALPAAVQKVLRSELPRLEADIWTESERESSEGVACNIGASACVVGRKGRMTEVPVTRDDLARMRELLGQSVLPAWVRRCGPGCADLWNRHLAATVGVSVGGQ